MRQITILILGDHDTEFAPHVGTREALRHAADAAGVIANTRWLGPDDLQLYPGIVSEAKAVVLAPPGPRSPRVLPLPTIASLTLIRQRDLPFLATGESHGLVVIELAREILGLKEAGSTRFDEDVAHAVVSQVAAARPEAASLGVHDLLIDVLAGSAAAALYGRAGRFTEKTDLVHGLNPDYAHELERVGFRPEAVDPQGGRPYLHAFEGRRFHHTAAFLPQLTSRRGAPHPLFAGLVAAALC